MIPLLIASSLALAAPKTVAWNTGEVPTKAGFSRPWGHLRPANAKTFSVRAVNAHSLKVEIFAASPESLVVNGDRPGVFRPVGNREFKHLPGEDGHWSRPLDLDSIRSVHGGAIVRLCATAYGPRGTDGNCGTWSIGSLDVVGFRSVGAFEELAVSDPSTARPVPGARLLLCDDRPPRSCARSVSDADGFARIAAPSPSWNAVVVRGLDAILVGANGAFTKRASQIPVANPPYFRSHKWNDFKGPSIWDPAVDKKLSKGYSLKGYRIQPYLARGVHMPGDSLIAGCLVRAPGGEIPPLRPVRVILRHDTVVLVDSAPAMSGLEGHYQVRLSLPPHAPTGAWSLRSEFDGDTSLAIPFSVEAEPPRRLEVHLKDSLIQAGPTITARLSATWLDGRSAAGLSARIRFHRQEKHTRETEHGLHSNSPGIRSQFQQGTPTTAVFDTSFEAILDAGGQMAVALRLGWNPHGWREAQYTISAEVLPPGGRPVAPPERKGFMQAGTEPYLHVESDSLETVLTPLVLTWAGSSARLGIPLHLRIRDPQTGGLVLDTAMASATSLRVPTSVWVGATADSPLRQGRFFQAELFLVSDSTVRARTELETGPTPSGTWCLFRYTGTHAESIWDLHPKPPAGPSLPAIAPQAKQEAPPPIIPSRTIPSPTPPPVLEVCWESLPGSPSLVQVAQGHRLLHQEWVRTRENTTCWKRPSQPRWWPSVVVAVHSLRGSEDSTVAVLQMAKRFHVPPPGPQVEVSVVPLADFVPNSVQPVRITNPLGIAGSVVVSSIDRGILDLDGHWIANPIRTLEEEDPLPDSWWTSQEEPPSEPAKSPRFHSYRLLSFESAREGHWKSENDRKTRSVGSNVVDMAKPEAWVSPVLRLPDTGLVVGVPVGPYTGSLRISAVALAGHSANVHHAEVSVRTPLESTWGMPMFLRPSDRTTVCLFLSGPPLAKLTLKWRSEKPLKVIGERTMRLALDAQGNGTVRVPLQAWDFPGPARIEGVVDMDGTRLVLTSQLDIKRSEPAPDTGRIPSSRLRWSTDTASTSADDAPILVEPVWVSPSGTSLDPWNLAEGSDVSLVLRLTNRSSLAVHGASLSMRLPAGWTLRSPRLEASRAGRKDPDPTLEAFEDRLKTSLDLPANTTKEITLPLHASHPGQYGGGGFSLEIPGIPSAHLARTFPLCTVHPR
ncbi:MAG: hypothetical protein IPN71_14795 [Fibrobacteres bacterium]|nr:hypothetical protein [Fibrobacterota bacterium]